MLANDFKTFMSIPRLFQQPSIELGKKKKIEHKKGSIALMKRIKAKAT